MEIFVMKGHGRGLHRLVRTHESLMQSIFCWESCYYNTNRTFRLDEMMGAMPQATDTIVSMGLERD